MCCAGMGGTASALASPDLPLGAYGQEQMPAGLGGSRSDDREGGNAWTVEDEETFNEGVMLYGK